MLESLIKGKGDIYELNLEGVFPRPKLYQSCELYESLKDSVLYDRERGQWNYIMSEKQELLNIERRAYNQLLGVLVETQLDLQNARGCYENLKETNLYDSVKEQWCYTMKEGQEFGSSDLYARDLLLGVLVEAQFNLDVALKQYEKLKQTPLYDEEKGQWNQYMDNWQRHWNSFCFADAQLLGVLTEAQFNPKAAQKMYDTLKQTPLHDTEREQWNEFMNEKQELKSKERYADIQLLAVLVEAQFNPDVAREKYRALKDNTPLYDTKSRQWNCRMDEEQVLGSTHRVVSAQLLAILVEAKLLNSLPRSITRTIPPLPIITEF